MTTCPNEKRAMFLRIPPNLCKFNVILYNNDNCEEIIETNIKQAGI
jgi:hypothetical protein